MHFIHRPYQPHETIAAIATPPGEGAVAIIRISGEHALAVAGKVFSRPVEGFISHTAHVGHVLNQKGQAVDEVLLMIMRGPRSYTGEDTVELQCHGGSLIARRVLETVLQAGARVAEPGEFTLKAFMNGKIDLSQAEAVQTLIASKNRSALKSAHDHLSGVLSKKIHTFQTALLDLIALLEAFVDFPEEGLEFHGLAKVEERLKALIEEISSLAATYDHGRLIQNGITLCLTGAPNVGKSSMMNVLLRKERAIVTEIAGTTRDLLEEDLQLFDLHFRLIDTAGIRETGEKIEREGIRRSREALQQADLILLMLDASRDLSEEDLLLINELPTTSTIAIWNKSDLGRGSAPLPFSHVLHVSVKTGEGIDALKECIHQISLGNSDLSKEEVLLTNKRHHEAVKHSLHFCQEALLSLSRRNSFDLISLELREALKQLGMVIGLDVGEEMLSAIFSKFCVGK